MFRFFVAHHVKLPRGSSTKSGKAKIVRRRIGTRATTRTVNAPRRW